MAGASRVRYAAPRVPTELLVPEAELPLHLAAKSGDISGLQEMLAAAEVELNALSPKGSDDAKTALSCAAAAGNIEAVQCLLTAKADCGCANKNGTTALHMACINGHTAMLE